MHRKCRIWRIIGSVRNVGYEGLFENLGYTGCINNIGSKGYVENKGYTHTVCNRYTDNTALSRIYVKNLQRYRKHSE